MRKFKVLLLIAVLIVAGFSTVAAGSKPEETTVEEEHDLIILGGYNQSNETWIEEYAKIRPNVTLVFAASDTGADKIITTDSIPHKTNKINLISLVKNYV